MGAPVIIGVDPGGQCVGIVARHRDELIYHGLLTRGDRAMAGWVRAVTQGCRDAAWAVPRQIGSTRPTVLAVEDLNPPTPHMGITSVRGLLDTAQVLGAVLHVYPGAIVVPPGGHGSGPIAAYPDALRPKTGRGRGHDRLRHCRSGWDVAGAAAVQIRLGQQGTPA